MGWNVFVFAPNELLSGERKLVIKSSSLPLKDILASPEFDWYPGLCLIAYDEFAGGSFAGIFNANTCRNVNRGREALSYFEDIDEHDLFQFWLNTHKGIQMAKMAQKSCQKETLRTITVKMLEMAEEHLSIFDINTFKNLAKREQISGKIDDKINRMIERRDRRYRPYDVEYDAMSLCAKGCNMLAGYQNFHAVCAAHIQYQANKDDTSANTEESLLADALRLHIPFHEIAMWIAR